MNGLTRLVVVSLALSGASVWAQCNQNCPEKRTISVTGTGTVIADADYAVVRVGYKLYGPDARAAYATATDTSNAIMQALLGAGIEKSAIESTSQFVQHTQPYEIQQYPGNSEYRETRQFTVSQSWMIRVKPDDAAKTLDTAIRAGANESGWIQWIVEDPTALEAQASAKAVENARRIAEQMAQKSNVHLGQLVSVANNQGAAYYAGMINGAAGSGLAAVGARMGTFDTVMVGNQQFAINSRRVVFNATLYAVFAIE